MKIGKSNRIYTLFNILKCLSIKTVLLVLHEDPCCFYCKGRIHIHREISVIFHHFPFLYLPDEVQQFLSSANSERGYHNISSAIKCSLYQFSQMFNIIRDLFMSAISVGRFHHCVISTIYVLRITYQRLVKISYISGEYYLSGFSALSKPKLDACRTKKMSRISEPHLDTFT